MTDLDHDKYVKECLEDAQGTLTMLTTGDVRHRYAWIKADPPRVDGEFPNTRVVVELRDTRSGKTMLVDEPLWHVTASGEVIRAYDSRDLYIILDELM